MNPAQDDFDRAMSRRLSKIGAMPVDTSHLDRALRGEIGSPGAPAWRRMIRPLAAVAASLVFLVIVGMALLQDRPAMASPDAMMQLHRDLVAHKGDLMQVDSVETLNSLFKAFADADMPMPQVMPAGMQHMECCMRDVAGKKVACVLFNDGKTPVTVSVADSADLKPIDSSPVAYNGESFHVHSSGDLTMVTIDRGSHRVCLIGQMPAHGLMELAQKLKFDSRN